MSISKPERTPTPEQPWTTGEENAVMIEFFQQYTSGCHEHINAFYLANKKHINFTTRRGVRASQRKLVTKLEEWSRTPSPQSDILKSWDKAEGRKVAELQDEIIRQKLELQDLRKAHADLRNTSLSMTTNEQQIADFLEVDELTPQTVKDKMKTFIHPVSTSESQYSSTDNIAEKLSQASRLQSLGTDHMLQLRFDEAQDAYLNAILALPRDHPAVITIQRSLITNLYNYKQFDAVIHHVEEWAKNGVIDLYMQEMMLQSHVRLGNFEQAYGLLRSSVDGVGMKLQLRKDNEELLKKVGELRGKDEVIARMMEEKEAFLRQNASLLERGAGPSGAGGGEEVAVVGGVVGADDKLIRMTKERDEAVVMVEVLRSNLRSLQEDLKFERASAAEWETRFEGAKKQQVEFVKRYEEEKHLREDIQARKVMGLERAEKLDEEWRTERAEVSERLRNELSEQHAGELRKMETQLRTESDKELKKALVELEERMRKEQEEAIAQALKAQNKELRAAFAKKLKLFSEEVVEEK
ncbi:hypothetical protein HDV00_000263 [Rhizophlyctis rosea]|nr:hypothetical protein HDV00_000263 [Rhizophlyctis rosea]